MPFPQVSLWQAFAIGIPFGIAGFIVQEAFIRRRPARTPANHPKAPIPEEPRQSGGETDPDVTAAATPAGTVPEAATPARIRKRTPTLRSLRVLESALDASIDVVVEFVDGPPRRARAKTCADELTRLVPRNKRGIAFGTFITALPTETGPAELQLLAEDVGIELATYLHRIRKEIKDLG